MRYLSSGVRGSDGLRGYPHNVRGSVWPELEASLVFMLPALVGACGTIWWSDDPSVMAPGLLFIVVLVWLACFLYLIWSRPWAMFGGSSGVLEIRDARNRDVISLDMASIKGFRVEFERARSFSRARPPMVFVHSEGLGWVKVGATSRLSSCRKLYAFLVASGVNLRGPIGSNVDPFLPWWKVYL